MPLEGPKWSWGLRTLLAVIILILCIVFWAGPMVLLLIALLAIAQLT